MTEIKLTLEQKVREAANDKRPQLNFKQFTAQRLHRDICRKLVDLSDTYQIPIAQLVYFAIATNAHKSDIFAKGYKTFREEKAKTIIQWLEQFAKYNKNPKLVTNADVIHVFSKYYDKKSTKKKDFNGFLKTYQRSPKVTNFKTLAMAMGID